MHSPLSHAQEEGKYSDVTDSISQMQFVILPIKINLNAHFSVTLQETIARKMIVRYVRYLSTKERLNIRLLEDLSKIL